MMGQFGDKLLSYGRDIPKINRPLPLSRIIKIDQPGCECSVDDTGARVSEIIIVRLVKLNWIDPFPEYSSSVRVWKPGLYF